MKSAQSTLNTRIIIASIVAAMLIVGLSGCGKSEAQKAAEQAAAQKAAERHDGRQSFKQAVVALKVRTDGATFDEFRKAEMDLKTSFEINKTYLEDVTNQFVNLAALVAATDYLWSESIHYPMPLTRIKIQMQAVETILPNPPIAQKTNYTVEQMQNDPDFWAKNYVPKGLAKIGNQADEILRLLEK